MNDTNTQTIHQYKHKGKTKETNTNAKDSKGIIRSRKLKKDRQYNDQAERDKRTYNDLQMNFL
jgi:hypothetical protein